MKNDTISKLLLMTAVATGFAGCRTDEGGHTFENKVFMSAKSFNPQLYVQTDEKVDELTYSFTVSMADAEAEDVEVNVAPALTEEYLAKYRKAYYNPSAQLLGSEHFDMPETKAVIRSGSVQSAPLKVNFTGLSGLDYSTDYVLPVTISSTSGLAVLNSAKTIYCVIKEASLINVVADITGNCAWPEWGEFEEVADMETFTMEALINPSAFTNKEIHTIMGIEDLFLVRIGDKLISKNQLQIATCRIDNVNNTSYRESLTSTSMKFQTGQWYHIAVTFDKGLTKVYIDGKFKELRDFSKGNVKLSSVNFKVKHSDESDGQPRCFWIGYSYNDERPFLGNISEVRIWKKVLTEDEINAPDHFYKIKDPASMNELVAYWKFNDGSGSKIKDWSRYGNDLKAASSVIWRDVELPVKDIQ